jgi:membrane-bound serine protease (ClpP class)
MGGLVALLCFMVFFWSRFLGGTAGWLEVVLFLAGMAFLAVELFLLPGFGVAGLSGILLVLVSLILASQTFILPRSNQELSTLTSSLMVVAGSGVAFAVSAVFLSRYFGSLPVFNRFMLAPPDRVQASSTAADVGADGEARLAPGDHGVASSHLRPAGKAQFGDRYVDVVADGDFIDKGTPIQIVEISGRRVIVERRA